jgi:hypothetical protein
MTSPKRPGPTRSAKAGRPPEEAVSPPRVRRRRKTAQAVLVKDTTILQTSRGPRASQPAARGPRAKKR